MRRLLVNVLLYAVFGGGLFAFAAFRNGGTVSPVALVVAVVVVALWSGGLTTAIDRLVPRLPAASTRVLAGATLGAASLGGFALALSLVVWRRPVPQLVVLAIAVGALMQAARTFAARPGPLNRDGAPDDDTGPKQLIAAGALVIDVREQSEWDRGHLAMARLVPVGELAARLDEVAAWAGGDKDAPVVVYCASGRRSERAKGVLEQAGFTHVANGGGFGELI